MWQAMGTQAARTHPVRGWTNRRCRDVRRESKTGGEHTGWTHSEFKAATACRTPFMTESCLGLAGHVAAQLPARQVSHDWGPRRNFSRPFNCGMPTSQMTVVRRDMVQRCPVTGQPGMADMQVCRTLSVENGSSPPTPGIRPHLTAFEKGLCAWTKQTL